MKKVVILAAAALTLAACAKTYELQETAQPKIGFDTWNDAMTKAKSDFAADDEFDVFGFKWNAGPTNQTTVFNGVDVKYNGTNWSYSPLRFWDSNFDNYTFFAAYPKDQLADGEYAQNGLFVSNELTYDGKKEFLLVAKKTDVASGNGGNAVNLNFKHVGSLVDIKVKKHTDIAAAKVEVTSIALSGIQTKGKFTVDSYNGSNNPVGKTVSNVTGLGWEPASTPVLNSDAAPYKNTSTVTLDKDGGVGTANAEDLLTDLVLMPQTLATNGGPMITISYKITTGEGATADVITFTGKSFFFGEFDKTDPDPTDKANTDPRISAWMPGVHYTYYITINANAITFTASIDSWDTTDATGHYYLIN